MIQSKWHFILFLSLIDLRTPRAHSAVSSNTDDPDRYTNLENLWSDLFYNHPDFAYKRSDQSLKEVNSDAHDQQKDKRQIEQTDSVDQEMDPSVLVLVEQIKYLQQKYDGQIQNMMATVNATYAFLDKQQAFLGKQQTHLEAIADQVIQVNSYLFDNLSPRDCRQAKSRGDITSRSYRIVIANQLREVYCDMESEGSAWIVFQRRYDGSIDFTRSWNDYEEGFGTLDGEFWFGLRSLHELTKSGKWELRIDLEDFSGVQWYARYDSFKIGDRESNYRLLIGDYSGTAGNALRGTNDLNNAPFSTFDKDNDGYPSINCAQDYQGGWWFKSESCTSANLNGLYPYQDGKNHIFMTWFKNMKRSEIKIRNTECN